MEKLTFLHEAVPTAKRVGLLIPSPVNPAAVSGLEAIGKSLGIDVETLEVQSADDIEASFDRASADGVDALIVFGATLFSADRSRIVRLATERGIPTLYPSHLFLDVGGLMDYGYVEASRGPRAAEYVKQILNGAKAGDLAMQPPLESELVINDAAAEAIGYSFPEPIRARATEQVRIPVP
jgi:putative ABC transport system substrate-binding protein